MPFGKYLKSQKIHKEAEAATEQDDSGTSMAPLDLLTILPRGEPLLVTDLGAQAELAPGDLRDALERLVQAGLVELTSVEGREAVALTDQGALLTSA